MPTAAGLYYFEHGDGGQQGKKTIVLLHGAGGVFEQWPHQMRRMSGYQVLAPDLPGHGRSKGSAFSSARDYAKEINDWL